ncbi:MAG: glycoside hydrolase family 16 protein [Clostridia bacterium]|nr:glycoside hydrolase family 16 protein [Clostridia bacterium]
MLWSKIAEALNLSIRETWAVEKFFEYFGNLFTTFSPKKIISTVLAMVEILQMLILGMPLTPRGQQLDLTGYNLVVYDEFEGDTLNENLWEVRGNGPRRCGYNYSSQVSVKDGNLVITGEYLEDGYYGEGWYTAAIKLRERYKQGYYEIRCICNDSPGYWSAFWIQADGPYTASISKGGVGGAEIDIFESTEYSEGKYAVTNTIHCAGVDGVQEGFQSAMLGKFYGNNITKEYNTYGLEWTEDEYIFYINGVETVRSSFGNGVSQVPEDVIVSLEIPDEEHMAEFDKETFRTEFIVDYVKIYQK